MRMLTYSDEHEAYRELVHRFLAQNVAPHYSDWEHSGSIPRNIYRELGEIGVLGIQIPEEFGGAGDSSYLYSAVLAEEMIRNHNYLGVLSVHLNVVLPYFLSYSTPEQKARWLPGMVTGDIMTAIAMTEPGAGSDLGGIATTAVRDGDVYVLNGAKTFISGGADADLVIVVARTSSTGGRREGLSLLVVERGTPGFGYGANLDKIGLKSQDTAELFFEDVRVPATNLLGDEGRAFEYLGGNLPRERLTIASAAVLNAETAISDTVAYVKERTLFDKPLSSFQNTKFELAACSADVAAARAMLDVAMLAYDGGSLTPADAARLKLFCTELQSRVLDRCLQLFGGYGYIRDYPIARMYADARVTRIFGGTSEIMKTIIAKSLGL